MNEYICTLLTHYNKHSIGSHLSNLVATLSIFQIPNSSLNHHIYLSITKIPTNKNSNMEMINQEQDTSLSLTLGRCAPTANNQPKQNPVSLTLSVSDDTVSSFSAAAYPGKVKRERDECFQGDQEGGSSRASDEDEDGNARKKLRLTKEQSALLEDRFKEHSTLNPKQKQALAKQLNLRPRQVEVWFQNRRARTKLKQTEVDYEFLKRCCETLTDENRRLQKELQELRGIKFASAAPLYMQLPAATLTMCPSCERVSAGPADGQKGNGAGGFAVVSKPHFFNPFTHSAAC